MRRFTAGDLYEKKYTGTISRYEKELARQEKKIARGEMVRDLLLQRMGRGRAA